MRNEEKVLRYIKADSNRKKLLGIALSVLRNRDEAEDALQDALLNCYKNRKRFRGQSAVSTWCYRVLMNAAFMRYRRERKHAGQDSSLSLDRFYSQSPTPEKFYCVQEALMLALRAISEKYRPVFLLRLQYGYTIDEVCAATGLRAGTVKAMTHRARKKAISVLENKPKSG